MSTQDWKNGELTQLLSEAWGFKFDTELLSEATPRVGDPETIAKGGDKTEEEGLEELEEERDKYGRSAVARGAGQKNRLKDDPKRGGYFGKKARERQAAAEAASDAEGVEDLEEEKDKFGRTDWQRSATFKSGLKGPKRRRFGAGAVQRDANQKAAEDASDEEEVQADTKRQLNQPAHKKNRKNIVKQDNRERERHMSEMGPPDGGALTEDSGAEESAHDRDNLAHDRYRMDDIEHHLDELEKHHADSDHIRDIRDRLHDLRKDMDYDYDEEHHDDNRYEDEAEPMDEGSGDRADDKDRNHARMGPGHGGTPAAKVTEAQIRKLVRAKLKAIMEAKNGRSKRVAKVSKRRK